MGQAATKPTERTTIGMRLYEEEAYWASILSKLTGGTIAAVLSPLIREPLRKALQAHEIDPDRMWSRAQKMRAAIRKARSEENGA